MPRISKTTREIAKLVEKISTIHRDDKHKRRRAWCARCGEFRFIWQIKFAKTNKRLMCKICGMQVRVKSMQFGSHRTIKVYRY